MSSVVNENGFIRNFLKETLLERVEPGKKWNPRITVPMMERTYLTESVAKEQRAKYKDKLLRIIEVVYVEAGREFNIRTGAKVDTNQYIDRLNRLMEVFMEQYDQGYYLEGFMEQPETSYSTFYKELAGIS